MASRLFEETRINGLKLANRFVRSAAWEGLASEDGTGTLRLSKLMAELAEGSVGLIISSHTYVGGDGQAGPWQLGIYEDPLVDGLREMTEGVYRQGIRSFEVAEKIVIEGYADYIASVNIHQRAFSCQTLGIR